MSRLLTSRVPDPMVAPPARWGILGTGWIAHAFVDALRTGTRQVIAAVGSRDAERAAAFAAAHDIPRSGTYADLVTADVDVVYVASPHSEHRDHALLALDAGKPVLVEKAFTRNAAEAREVVTAARERGLFCMEAMWSRFLPHYDIVRQLVQEGALGEIQTVSADHGQRLYPDGPRRLADPGLAGGALLDLGIYPVSFASMVLGDLGRPTAVGTLTGLGVDAQVSVLARTPGGAHAVLNATMTARTPTVAVVSGTEGRIELDGDFYVPGSGRVVASDGRVVGEWGPADDAHRGLRFEAAEVARRLAAGETSSPVMSSEETVRIMEFLDAIRAQIGEVYPGEA
ncbi:MAG: Gfo/Idh/MocA family oxidoreductase [Dermatophilaceae bacterium]